MGEITKLVANRQSNAQVVITALQVHAKGASGAITAALFPQGAPPKGLSVEMFIEALGAALAHHAEVIQQTKVVHAALAKGAPKAAAKKGRKLDFAALAEDLQVHITALEAALKDIKREEREAEQALTKRDAAVAAFETVYTGVAEIAAGLLELAGQGDLASRVKPTVRRRAGLDLPAVEPSASPEVLVAVPTK